MVRRSPFGAPAVRRLDRLSRCDVCTAAGVSVTVHPVDGAHYCDTCIDEDEPFVYDDMRGEYVYTMCHICNVESACPRQHRAHCNSKRHRARLAQLHAPVALEAVTSRARFEPLLKADEYTRFFSPYEIDAMPELSLPLVRADTVSLARGSGKVNPSSINEKDERDALQALFDDDTHRGVLPTDDSLLSSIKFLRASSPPADIEQFVRDVDASDRIIGFDTEGASPALFPNVTTHCPPPHVMQLACKDSVWIYELSSPHLHHVASQPLSASMSEGPAEISRHTMAKADRGARVGQEEPLFMPPMIPSVRDVLSDRQTTLVGFGLQHEVKALRRLQVGLDARLVDIGLLFWSRALDGDTDAAGAPTSTRLVPAGSEGLVVSASQAVARVLGHRFSKPKGLQASNWAVRPLSCAQVVYASRDAVIARMMYCALQGRLKRAGK